MSYQRGDRLRMPVRGAFMRADVNDDERTIPFVLSTEGFKRDGINLRAEGWRLEHFERNPVMLWAHDPREFPIGRGENVRVEDGALRGVARFTTREENPAGDMAFKLYRGGYLNAVSVGFELVEFDETDGKIDSRAHTLEEFSGVPLPLDRDALAAGRAAGIDVSPMRRYAVRLLDTFADDEEMRREVERVYQAVREPVSYHQVTEDIAPSSEALARMLSQGSLESLFAAKAAIDSVIKEVEEMAEGDEPDEAPESGEDDRGEDAEIVRIIL